MAVAIGEDTLAQFTPHEPVWHGSAPRRVVARYQAGDPAGGWRAWQKYLARRKKPESPRFLAGKDPPLLWGGAPEIGDAGSKIALGDMERTVDMLAEPAAPYGFDLTESLQILALAYALPELVGKLPADSWWQIVERLHHLAGEAQQPRIDWNGDAANVLRHQLLAAELPLALGYLFPEIDPLRSLQKSARSAFSEALLELTDGRGMPHARLLPVFGQLFACWTRARWIGKRLARGAWSREAENQYRWLVRHAIRMADADGRFILTPTSTGVWTRSLFSTALELAANDKDCAAAVAALPVRVVPKNIELDNVRLPDPTLHSEWSGIGVMADGWSPSSLRLAVAFAEEPISLELAIGKSRLLAGPWTFQTTCDGQPVRTTGEWEELCWQSDKHADFLELGMELSAGLRLERQLLFGKQDRVLYMADIIVAADGSPRRLTHSIELPLAADAHWQAEADTRDGLLVAGKRAAAVMPLALPEWRTDSRGGALSEQSGRLVLTQEATGRALCCPLFFDLQSNRAKKDRTWRQLTVAEWMEVLPRDVAVGFRAQSGRGQWLIYRSLGPAGNRTLLGRNIAGEFCAGRFHASGKFDEWLEIEAV